MAKSNNNLKAVLQDTADAIRAKTGSSSPIVPRDFADEISGIQTGGGDEDFKNFLTGDLKSFNYSASYFENKELRAGAFAFAEMYNVSLDGCWRVRESMFYGATIDNVNINDALIIEESAFASCETPVIVANNVREVGDCAFQYCYAERIELPRVIKLSTRTFMSCPNLKEVVFGDDLAEDVGDTFKQCSSLEKVDLKNASRAYMSSYGFSGCYNLKSIILHRTVSLGSGCFHNCYNLEKIENDFLISGTASWAFAYCSSLKEINLFFNLVNIASYTFFGCHNLSKIIFGHQNIQSNAFSGCSKLESIFMLTCSIPTLSANAFSGTPIADSSYLGYYGSIYVPSSKVSNFKTANNWSAYADRIAALPSEYEEDYVFAYEYYNRTDLTAVPSEKVNARFVGVNAFYHCNMSTLTHSNFVALGNSAFMNQSTFLSSVSLPNLKWCIVSQLGSPFTPGKSLTYISVPNCVEMAGNTFANTSYLMSSCNFDSLIFAGLGNQTNLINGFSLPNARRVAISGVFSATLHLSNIYMPKATGFQTAWVTLSSSIYLSNILILSLNSVAGIEYLDAPDLLELSIYSCSQLSSINCPKLISIYCPSAKLSNVDFSRVIRVGGGAFSDCSLLTKAKFDALEKVVGSAFMGCSSLSKVLFKRAEIIAYNGVFLNCSSLESLYLFGKSVTMLDSQQSSSYNTTFDNTPFVDSSYLGHFGSIFVPAHLLSDYQGNYNWASLSSCFVGMTESEMQYVIDHWDD